MYRLPAQAIVPTTANLIPPTLADMGDFDRDGSFNLPEAAAKSFGATNISWQQGQSPVSTLPLGVWNTVFGVGDLTTKQLNPQAPDLNGAALSNFGFLKGQNIGSLVQAIPSLKHLPIAKIQPIADAVGTLIGRNAPSTIGDLANNPLYAQKLLPPDLSKYAAGSIPGLTDTPLKNFPGVMGKATAIDVPGLAQFPIPQMPKVNTPAMYQMARFDLIRTKEVAERKVLSGSSAQPNAVCTDASKCNSIEVQGVIGGVINGGQIIDGDTQQVSGGYGILGALNNYQEAPGFYPYGGSNTEQGIKEVYYNFQAQAGTIDRGWYANICHADYAFGVKVFDWGCTPHFIGPLPLGKLHEGSQIPLFLGNISIPVPAGEIAPVAGEVAATLSNVNNTVNQLTGIASGSSNRGAASPEIVSKIPGVPNISSIVGGIDPQKLTNAIVNILPNGNAKQIGQLLNATAQEIDPDTGAKFTGSKLIDRITTKYIAGNNAEIGSDAQSINLGMSVSEIVAKVSQNYGQK
jgi:hypothetical protein